MRSYIALVAALFVCQALALGSPRVGLAPARLAHTDRRRHHSKLATRSVVPIVSRAEHDRRDALVKRAAAEDECEDVTEKTSARSAAVQTDDEECEDEVESQNDTEEDCEDDEDTSASATADEECEEDEPTPSPKPTKAKAAAKVVKTSSSSTKSQTPSPSPSPKKKEAAVKSSNSKQQTSPVLGGTSGTATFFNQGGTEGACGRGKVGDDALVVALCPSQFRDACGKSIRITNTNTGKTVTAIGNDECPECACDHLDLSIGLWDALGSPQSLGVAPIKFTIG